MSRPRLHDWDNLPLLYVSQAWLARVTGIKLAAIAKTMRKTGSVSKLTPFAARRFGDYASTMREWVESWGADRVLAFLDKYDTHAADVLRSGIDKLGNEVQDREHALRRHEEAKRQRAKVRKGYRAEKAASLADSLATQPLGLVPVATIASIAGVAHLTVAAYLQRHGIAPYSEQRLGFPHGVGSWDAIVSAWGIDRTREWVTNYRPQLMAWFNRRALPAEQRQKVQSAPLGCLPDGVIAVAFDVSVAFVRELRNERGAARFSVSTNGPFPDTQGSFARIAREMGKGEARAWLTEWAPQYLEAFDSDMAYVRPKPAPVVKPTKAATHKPKPGKAWRASHDQVIAMNTLVNAAKEREETRAKLRPTTTPAFGTWPDEDPKHVERARINDAMAEFLARGGKVKKLVGAGSPGVGQVLDVREFGGVDA